MMFQPVRRDEIIQGVNANRKEEWGQGLGPEALHHSGWGTEEGNQQRKCRASRETRENQEGAASWKPGFNRGYKEAGR